MHIPYRHASLCLEARGCNFTAAARQATFGRSAAMRVGQICHSATRHGPPRGFETDRKAVEFGREARRTKLSNARLAFVLSQGAGNLKRRTSMWCSRMSCQKARRFLHAARAALLMLPACE